jgi:hypothetical protein
MRAKPNGASRHPSKARARRTPLPAEVPRPEKLDRGRTMKVPPPAHLRVIGADLTDEDREYAGRKLGAKLGKFAASVERITLRLTDDNGPRGGADQLCRIKVVLAGLPSVTVERLDVTPRRAIDAAIGAATLAVRDTLARRRMKPLRRTSGRF